MRGAGKLPLIGVSTINDNDAAGVHMPRYSNNQAYCKAIEAAGGVPLLIPQLEDADMLRRIYEVLDGLLVPGGVDMHPKFYGQEPHPALDPMDVGLDRVETTILPWALEDDLPILGICRGEQVLNVVMGGTLIQDIYTQYTTAIDHRESAKRRIRDYLAHDMVIDPDTKLRELTGESRIWVNTAHHQSIDKVAPGLIASAWAPDGIIEAVESPDRHYVLAVQCHPEILYRKHPWAFRIFESFVAAAAETMHSTRRGVPRPAIRTASIHTV